MDRFIGILKKVMQSLKRYLKSNMDRFIASTSDLMLLKLKI